MNKLVDAAIVAALLMINCPEPPPADDPAQSPTQPPAQVAEESHGHRPCS